MKSFVILVPSYKNIKWYRKNLASILNQDYPNYRVIYTDDLSPDGTGEAVEKYIAQNNVADKIKLIRNETRKGALQNLYEMAHSCHDDEILVTVDGDDWLAHNGVLRILNHYYSSAEVWMTWGSYLDYPNKTRGCSKPFEDRLLKQGNFRSASWRMSHLRTFYAWLFKKIRKEDLMHQGKFWMSAWDLALMFPMIEMARERSRYLEEPLYMYNNENPIQDWKVRLQEQNKFTRIIKSKAKYSRL